MQRTSLAERSTKETDITVRLALDGSGKADVGTGLPFLDHMLCACARHGYLDLTVRAKGDLEVDAHHTIEDVGLVLGQAIREAVGDRAGLKRYGAAYVPMDDALARVVLDLSGRPFLAYRVHPVAGEVGGFASLLFREFFRALANAGAITLHVDRLAGEEPHHVFEAVFKALGKALDQATRPEPRSAGVPSTKGGLD